MREPAHHIAASLLIGLGSLALAGCPDPPSNGHQPSAGASAGPKPSGEPEASINERYLKRLEAAKKRNIEDGVKAGDQANAAFDEAKKAAVAEQKTEEDKKKVANAFEKLKVDGQSPGAMAATAAADKQTQALTKAIQAIPNETDPNKKAELTKAAVEPIEQPNRPDLTQAAQEGNKAAAGDLLKTLGPLGAIAGCLALGGAAPLCAGLAALASELFGGDPKNVENVLEVLTSGLRAFSPDCNAACTTLELQKLSKDRELDRALGHLADRLKKTEYGRKAQSARQRLEQVNKAGTCIREAKRNPKATIGEVRVLCEGALGGPITEVQYDCFKAVTSNEKDAIASAANCMVSATEAPGK